MAAGPGLSPSTLIEGSYKPSEKLVEGATARTGFFDTYEKDGHLYMAVPADRVGRDFLMNFEIAQGIGAAGLFGGTIVGARSSS